MRRKFNPDMFEYIQSISKDKTTLEILDLVNFKFNENFTKKSMGQYLNRNKIEWKRNENKVRDMSKLEIGSEYTKPDGMVMIKVAKNKWMYKQRYIYEQYYNTKLKEDEYIIFLDNDRTNFNISNLYKANRRVAGSIGVNKLNRRNLANHNNENITKLLIAIKESMLIAEKLEGK